MFNLTMLPDFDAFHSKVVDGAAKLSSREFLFTHFDKVHKLHLQISNLRIVTLKP